MFAPGCGDRCQLLCLEFGLRKIQAPWLSGNFYPLRPNSRPHTPPHRTPLLLPSCLAPSHATTLQTHGSLNCASNTLCSSPPLHLPILLPGKFFPCRGGLWMTPYRSDFGANVSTPVTRQRPLRPRAANEGLPPALRSPPDSLSPRPALALGSLQVGGKRRTVAGPRTQELLGPGTALVRRLPAGRAWRRGFSSSQVLMPQHTWLGLGGGHSTSAGILFILRTCHQSLAQSLIYWTCPSHLSPRKLPISGSHGKCEPTLSGSG